MICAYALPQVLSWTNSATSWSFHVAGQGTNAQAKDTVELLKKQARPISEEVKRIAQRLMSQRRVSQSAAAAEASSNDD